MSKLFKNPFKNSKLKAFFFFLILAMVFWVLTKFSREYTATVFSKIDYTNVPETALLSEDNIHEISFDLTETGFEFLFYKLKKPTISINVGAYANNNSKEVIVPETELKKIINTQISAKVTVKNLSNTNLNIRLDSLISKKIAVVPNVDLTFKNGFKPVSGIKVLPDSVVVSGASEYVKEIDSVRTASFSEENIEKPIDVELKIEPFSDRKVTITPNTVKLQVMVDEFSQKEMILPIEVLNVPESTTLKLIPNVIKISFSVSLAEFKNIEETDFLLVCDFAERNKEENFMIPKLTRFPEGIVDIEFETKKIDYLTFK